MYKIIRKEVLNPVITLMEVEAPRLASAAQPGQFLIVRVDEEGERVPLTICDYNREKGTVTIEVSCSKGTYIRTLCEDIGQKLGCGAYMNTLIRTKSADFTLDNSFSQEELLKMKEDGTLNSAVIPVDKLFLKYDAVSLDAFLAEKAKNGVRIRKKGLTDGAFYRVYDENNIFLCISKYTNGELVLEKAFWN